jgi:hypothetical protein
VINPGSIDTPGERAFASEEQIQRAGASIPWGRIGTPRDIGKAAAFLASLCRLYHRHKLAGRGRLPRGLAAAQLERGLAGILLRSALAQAIKR